MFGLEKFFNRPEQVGLDKAALDLGTAIKDLAFEEKDLVRKLIEELNEFLRKDYEASL